MGTPPDFSSEAYRRYLTEQTRALSFEGEHHYWSSGLQDFVRHATESLPRAAVILDCACGDGTGLAELRHLGFSDVLGIDICLAKIDRARKISGASALFGDMHDIPFPAGTFDFILSSHSLEHAYDPALVLSEFRRVLKPTGSLGLCIPWVDAGPPHVHSAKHLLRTDQPDLSLVLSFFEQNRFRVLDHTTSGARGEPELRLSLAPQP